MSDIVIKAEHLSKYYRLGAINHGMLYKDLQSWLARKLGKEDPHSQIGQDHFADRPEGFWALKDLNFEIKQGDRVGIIGKNGAGKSTLLKILSRITAPTEGQVKIKGRVASLLEVGTGFHGELTGRENIYLNGAILGMKRREITKKLDEIIAFSEIEQHIDTPVKRYSSGMYVRLAFAVAAHLDSDILIADEVLAVGDAAFQKKALGKMSDLSTGQGRTVLFVSHNMDAVRQLCSNGLILGKGRLQFSSQSIFETVDRYLGVDNFSETEKTLWSNDEAKGDSRFLPLRIWITDSEGVEPKQPLSNDVDYVVNCRFSCSNSSENIAYSFHVKSSDGGILFVVSPFNTCEGYKIKRGINEVSFILPRNFLNLGIYTLELEASVFKTEWILEPGRNAPCVYLNIQRFATMSAFYASGVPGCIAPFFEWVV